MQLICKVVVPTPLKVSQVHTHPVDSMVIVPKSEDITHQDALDASKLGCCREIHKTLAYMS